MDGSLYHIEEVTATLRKLNPHLELKEYRKNIGNFTVDFDLTLGRHEAVVAIPMDRFRDYDRGGREDVFERLENGYVRLLRKIEKTSPG